MFDAGRRWMIIPVRGDRIMAFRWPKLKSGRKLDFVLGILLKVGLFDAVRYFTPSLLTILNYHRIDDPYRPDFDTFKPNVSATPAEFERQMDYIQSRYSVITCQDLLSWLKGERILPPRPLMITFDDGYFDNLKYAAPILRERALPAVVFLATGFIGTSRPLYWDYVANLFFHSRKTTAQLPLMGAVSWTDPVSREKIVNSWISMVKKLPDEERIQVVSELEEILDVSASTDAFFGLYLTWEQIREMTSSGFEFGSHTVHHPILTRVSISRVDEELSESKKQIESRIGRPVIAFAYPNGLAQDFSDEVVAAVSKSNIPLAFTLLPGPAGLKSVRKNPLMIRRIFLVYTDSFPRFAAKLLGLNRLI